MNVTPGILKNSFLKHIRLKDVELLRLSDHSLDTQSFSANFNYTDSSESVVLESIFFAADGSFSDLPTDEFQLLVSTNQSPPKNILSEIKEFDCRLYRATITDSWHWDMDLYLLYAKSCLTLTLHGQSKSTRY